VKLTPVRVHLGLMGVWAALAVPTLLWWRESVFWVVLMSWYAIVVGHWSSFEAANSAPPPKKRPPLKKPHLPAWARRKRALKDAGHFRKIRV
jgi:hypothetical protein